MGSNSRTEVDVGRKLQLPFNNFNNKQPWLFPSEDSQSFPPPRPPRLLVSSPEPPCGTAQTELSGSDHTLRTPAHPASRVSTLVTTAGTPPVSLPTQRPSPPTESASWSTPDGPCPELSDASSLRSSTPPTTPLGSRPVPSSSPTVVLTTSATHPWSTPRASSPSWDARLSSWDSPKPTE